MTPESLSALLDDTLPEPMASAGVAWPSDEQPVAVTLEDLLEDPDVQLILAAAAALGA